MLKFINPTFSISFVLSLIITMNAVADWPTYRADIARSGNASGQLDAELNLQWVYHPSQAPKPAWPAPAAERPRMHVDNAYHSVIANDIVYFAVSMTDKIYAIDINTGDVCWDFYTEGPVRFAPVFSDGKLYAGSDDGYVYCLDGKDGSLLWKYRAGPSDEKVIGNGRMISMWPVRTGLLVDGGVVYFAAGVFPYEGLYICALQADDGEELWINDTIGDRAHEFAYGGMSPYGYPVASSDILYIPSGRSMPTAFNRHTGEFLYNASPGGKRGGAWALLDKDRLISGVDYSGVPHKVEYDAATGRRNGDLFAWFPGIDLVVSPDVSYVLTLDGIYAIDRAKYAACVEQSKVLDQKRKLVSTRLSKIREGLRNSNSQENNQLLNELVKELSTYEKENLRLKTDCYLWKHSGKNFSSLIKYGKIIFAGGDNKIVAINAASGKETWRSDIQGRVTGLSASDSGLIVSSDQGPVYCFSKVKTEVVKETSELNVVRPHITKSLEEKYRLAAKELINSSRWQKGYALVINGDEGPFADELARLSDLQIIVLESNPVKRDKARQYLLSTGMYGTRVVVEPWDIQSLPVYFANLIVADGLSDQGDDATTAEERFRLLRPYGGEEYQPLNRSEIVFSKNVRGKLQGAGNWTQQYGDPQNSACSYDKLVNGPLGISWFGEPGPQGMVERHARAQSPVAMDGRLFVEGEELIMAVDAYNGTLLWQREIPGAVRVKTKADCGNLCITKDGLFIAALDKCYRLDPETGDTVQIYDLPIDDPGVSKRWGYLSVVDGALYGSAATPMTNEYAHLLKTFLANGQWRSIDEVPNELHEQYKAAKTSYPLPVDLVRAAQRSGTTYRSMTSFARSGEFTQKNSVSDSLMVCNKIFGMDVNTGDLLWEYSKGRIANITIVLGDGKIFFADSDVNSQQRTSALDQRKRYIREDVYRERQGVLDELREKQKKLEAYTKRTPPTTNKVLAYLVDSLKAELFQEEHPEGTLTYDDTDVRLVTALDMKTGAKVWEEMVDLTGCGGDKMGASYHDGRLLFFGNHGNHDAWRFREGGMKWRRITVLSGDAGDMAWSHPLNYRTRPVIVGNKVILEPRACDLRTGEEITRIHPVTGENVPWEFLRPGHTCGISAASAQGLFYRSACTVFYDLEKDRGITTFGAYRPGCAISVIPACGMLLSPEAAAGCTCSYPIRCSVALVRKPERSQPWTIFVTPGALKPVKRLAINLGAVADMKDDDGTVWFGYPSPNTSSHNHFPNYGVKFNLKEDGIPGMKYFNRDHKNTDISGTDKPWLFTSGCVGLTRCRIPLLDADDKDSSGIYTIRLGFMPLEDDETGQRVFSVKLQDDVVLEDIDIHQSSGSLNQPVVKEFKNISVQDDLVLELIQKNPSSTNNEATLINFIEIIQEDV